MIIREQILIIDDQEDVRDYLYYTLVALQKYDVLTAKSGEEGLEIINNQKVDLVITDQQMPEMSGLEMLGILKAQYQQIPAILATGRGSEETAVSAFRLGVLDYLIKPIEPEELRISVEKALYATRLESERTKLLQELLRNNSNLQQHAREFNTLYGIGKTINSTYRLDTIFHRAVDGAIFAVDADEGGLVLWDKEESCFRISTIKEQGDETHTTTQLSMSKLVERAFRTAEPVLVHKEMNAKISGENAPSKSSLHVPILSHGLPIGVLYVINKKPDVSLNRRDTQILIALADYVALAIRQTELHELTTAKADGVHKWQALEDEIGNLDLLN